MTTQHPGDHDPTEPEREDGTWPEATDAPTGDEATGEGTDDRSDEGADYGTGETEIMDTTGSGEPSDHQADDHGYGAPPPPPPAAPTPPVTPVTPTGPTPPSAIPSESRNWAMGAHLSAIAASFVGGLSLLGPLVVWLIKKDEDAFVAHHAKEALNFNLSILIYMVAALVLTIVTLGIGLIVVLPLGLLAFLGWLVVTILAAVKASNGEGYRYPLTIRLIN